MRARVTRVRPGGDVQQYTVHRMEIPWWLKIVNGLVRVAGWLGMPFGKLDSGSVLAAASRKTQLYDWGDRRFIDIMERLMLEADAARVTPLGEIVLRQTCLAAVMNRLRIEDYINRHPEVSEGHSARRAKLLRPWPSGALCDHVS